MVETARGIHGAIRRDAVRLGDDVVFLAVARSGVDRAGSLFERHVIAQDAERIAFKKGMAEDRSVQFAPLKWASRGRLLPAASLAPSPLANSSATM